jgi:hypothetical protein
MEVWYESEERPDLELSCDDHNAMDEWMETVGSGFRRFCRFCM